MVRVEIAIHDIVYDSRISFSTHSTQQSYAYRVLSDRSPNLGLASSHRSSTDTETEAANDWFVGID